MGKHINTVATLHIVLSILGFLVGFFIFAVLFFAGDISDDFETQKILSIVGKVIVAVIIILSLPGLIAGIGLYKRKEWARILTLVISVVNLLNFPIGTAIGVYSLWALVQPEVVDEFKEEHGTIRN